MPCYDDRGKIDNSIVETLRDDLRKTEAMLCAVLSAFEGDQRLQHLNKIDEKKAGITKDQIMNWYLVHLYIDSLRR